VYHHRRRRRHRRRHCRRFRRRCCCCRRRGRRCCRCRRRLHHRRCRRRCRRRRCRRRCRCRRRRHCRLMRQNALAKKEANNLRCDLRAFFLRRCEKELEESPFSVKSFQFDLEFREDKMKCNAIYQVLPNALLITSLRNH
jgi:hypothetical protein